MKVEFQFARSEHGKFKNACEAAISRVGSGSKQAVIEATQEIMIESMNQVPRDTGTLARSAFVGVSRRIDTRSAKYGAVLGYGKYEDIGFDLGGIDWIWEPQNPQNPKHGFRASVYAGRVHEDLSQPHKNGKAKFLEDPVREWAGGRFARTAFSYWKQAIQSVDRYQRTSMSDADINKLIKQGKVVMPDLEEARKAFIDAKNNWLNNNTKENAAAVEAAAANYKQARAAAVTYRTAYGSTSTRSHYAYGRNGYKVRSDSLYQTVLMRRHDSYFVDASTGARRTSPSYTSSLFTTSRSVFGPVEPSWTTWRPTGSGGKELVYTKYGASRESHLSGGRFQSNSSNTED